MSQRGAESAVFSPRVAEKGNSNVLAHFSLNFYGILFAPPYLLSAVRDKTPQERIVLSGHGTRVQLGRAELGAIITCYSQFC